MPRELEIPPYDEYTEAKFMSYGPKLWRLEIDMADGEAYEYAVLNITRENAPVLIKHLQAILAEMEGTNDEHGHTLNVTPK